MFDDKSLGRADWPLLQNGAVNLYWRRTIFEQDKLALRELGYVLFEFRFSTIEPFRIDFSHALNWAGQFGYEPWTGNLDALNDGFRYVPFGPSKCAAVCVEGYDRLKIADEALGFHLLDIIERQSRNCLLFGERLIGMIQTDDPQFRCDGLAANSASWNRREWLSSARR